MEVVVLDVVDFCRLFVDFCMVWSRQPHDPEVAKHLVDDGQERLLFMTADVWVSPIDNDLCYSQQILGPTNSTVTKRNTAEPTRIIVVETNQKQRYQFGVKVVLKALSKELRSFLTLSSYYNHNLSLSL
ncbi:hypothetical protein Q8A73_023136 [Channa argus]|nr:hypothetical protein Q8A73_023136 [Channa argus]